MFTPTINWTKPLTPCGPPEDPDVKLHGTVEILGTSFHAEAYQVTEGELDAQVGVQDEADTYLSEVLEIVGSSAQTIRLNEREYVLAITPHQA